MKTPPEIYKILLKEYGPQGWWPITTLANKPGFDERGYHKSNNSYPKTEQQIFEICLGAILTQNTSWKNVEKAIISLQQKNMLGIKAIRHAEMKKLAVLIKSSGYHNQKARKIKEFIKFLDAKKEINRENLLAVWGIGKETADSMLLYAHNQPIFVIDAYAIRIFSRLFKKEFDYDTLQELFMKSLKKEPAIFNEYHALLVEQAKNVCKTKPDCPACCLKKDCKFFAP